MTTKEIRQLLQDHFSDEKGHVTYSRGVWTVREGYFYRHGRSEANVVAEVQEILPAACVIDSGDHLARFRGGASIQASSHWWVKFTV